MVDDQGRFRWGVAGSLHADLDPSTALLAVTRVGLPAVRVLEAGCLWLAQLSRYRSADSLSPGLRGIFGLPAGGRAAR